MLKKMGKKSARKKEDVDHEIAWKFRKEKFKNSENKGFDCSNFENIDNDQKQLNSKKAFDHRLKQCH